MMVELTSETEAYVTRKISSGSYSSSRDVIEAGIHLLQEKDDLASPVQEKNYSVNSIHTDEEAEAKIKAGERLLREIGQRYRQQKSTDVLLPERVAWSSESIESAYGSLADDPVELLPQGDYPVIDPIL